MASNAAFAAGAADFARTFEHSVASLSNAASSQSLFAVNCRMMLHNSVLEKDIVHQKPQSHMQRTLEDQRTRLVSTAVPLHLGVQVCQADLHVADADNLSAA